MPDQYIIKEAVITDIDDIIALWTGGNIEQKLITPGNLIDKQHLVDTFRQYIELQTNDFKFWICSTPENEVIGYQSILPFHLTPNPDLRNCFGQSSTYVKNGWQKNGIGKMLLKHALDHCRHTHIKYVFGLVLSDNEKSLQMCDNLGFTNMGRLPKNKVNGFEDWNFVVYEV